MLCLGHLYQTGLHGPDGPKEAFTWYDKAMRKWGSPVAVYSLGVLYAKGAGTPQDLKKAWEYFYTAKRSLVGTAVPALDLVSGKLDPNVKEKLFEKPRVDQVLVHVHFLNLAAADGEFPMVVKLDALP